VLNPNSHVVSTRPTDTGDCRTARAVAPATVNIERATAGEMPATLTPRRNRRSSPTVPASSGSSRPLTVTFLR